MRKRTEQPANGRWFLFGQAIKQMSDKLNTLERERQRPAQTQNDAAAN